jgi:hypothetical protein
VIFIFVRYGDSNRSGVKQKLRGNEQFLAERPSAQEEESVYSLELITRGQFYFLEVAP